MMIDITKIERIDLKSGEVLHVKSAVMLSCDQNTRIHQTLKKVFPDNKIVISDKRVDISLEAIKPEV